jgi:hypothetical protein
MFVVVEIKTFQVASKTHLIVRIATELLASTPFWGVAVGEHGVSGIS